MIAIEAPKGQELLLRHLAEQFFPDAHQTPRTVRAWELADGARVEIGQHTGDCQQSFDYLSPHARRKLRLALAFAQAALSAGCDLPAYGVLTGVRPTKPALTYLQLFGPQQAPRRLQEDYLVALDKARVLVDLAQQETELAATLKPRDVLLYVSIPFCPSRCAYCSFISSAAPKHLQELPAYLSLLHQELKGLGELCRRQGLRVRGLYVGGGTPGVLSAQQIQKLMETLHANFDLRDAEITCEIGRPDTVTEDKLRALKDTGVQRLSINTQTTDDRVLKVIGRTHTAGQFFDAFALAKSFGFSSLNVDLIAGLPGEEPQGFLNSLEQVLALEPENLTVHSFCQKRSADWGKHRLADRDQARRMLEESYCRCINRGFRPYYLYRQKNATGALENTGFAQPGKDCFYNVAMMEDLLPVLAAGAGGISKVPGPTPQGKIQRLAQFKYPFEYLAHPERIPEAHEQLERLIENLYTE